MSQLLKSPKSGSVLSFGELLIRLSPDTAGRWLAEHQLPIHIGGAELNVARALALWKVPVKYFTALPENYLSSHLVRYLGDEGIDTSQINFSGDRIGLYYLTHGLDLKSGVIYDRAGSSFDKLNREQLDWDKIFDGISWFHFSAICPAISQNVANICLDALIAASNKGIPISVDLNLRETLWKYGKTPSQVMPHLVAYCNVVMGNIWASQKMLAIDEVPANHKSHEKRVYVESAFATSKRIMEQFPQCFAVANTFRLPQTNDVEYYTALYTSNELYLSAQYDTTGLTAKAGSGDCFMAGLIYGFYNELSPEQTVKFATAAAFLKLSIVGDATTSTIADIKKAMK